MESIHGYIILKATLFEDGCGVALGENPNAPNPYVTWRLTQKDGQRDYRWGHYHNKRDVAEADFADRVSYYKRMNHVQEVMSPKRSVREKLEESTRKIEGGQKCPPSKKIKRDYDR